MDDEKNVREISKATLEDHGYVVIMANDGVEALDAFREYNGKISVVVTDMMMPRMDGAGMIKELKRLNPAVKIIATSGLTALTDPRSEASIKEARAFIPKPYTTESLLRTLRQVILENESSEIQSR